MRLELASSSEIVTAQSGLWLFRVASTLRSVRDLGGLEVVEAQGLEPRHLRQATAWILRELNERPRHHLLRQVAETLRELRKLLEHGRSTVPATPDDDSLEAVAGTALTLATMLALSKAATRLSEHLGDERSHAAFSAATNDILEELDADLLEAATPAIFATLLSTVNHLRLWATCLCAELGLCSELLSSTTRSVLVHGAINHGVPQQLDGLVLRLATTAMDIEDLNPAARAYCYLGALRLVLLPWQLEEVEEMIQVAAELNELGRTTSFSTMSADNDIFLEQAQDFADLLRRNPNTSFDERFAIVSKLYPHDDDSQWPSRAVLRLFEDGQWQQAAELGTALLQEEEQAADSYRLLPLVVLCRVRAGMCDDENAALSLIETARRLLGYTVVAFDAEQSGDVLRAALKELAVHHANLRTAMSNRICLLAVEALKDSGLLRLVGETRAVDLDTTALRLAQIEVSFEEMRWPKELVKFEGTFILFVPLWRSSESWNILRVWGTARSQLMDASVQTISGRNLSTCDALLTPEREGESIDNTDLGRLGRLLFPYEVEHEEKNWTICADVDMLPLPWPALARFRLPDTPVQEVRHAQSLSSFTRLPPAPSVEPGSKVVGFFCPSLEGALRERAVLTENDALHMVETDSVESLVANLEVSRPTILAISAHGQSGSAGEAGVLIAGTMLTAAMLSRLPLPPIVVLGSCFAADAGSTAMEFDLIQACLVGGAAAVIAAPGLLDDLATSAVLSGMYAALGKGMFVNVSYALHAGYMFAEEVGYSAAQWGKVKYFGR